MDQYQSSFHITRFQATMATDEQALDQDPSLETELDEASIMSSLARLQELHISVRIYVLSKTKLSTRS